MTAADANGAYELRGLAPGHYEVQACLDGVWLSAVETITIEEGFESDQTLDLDVLAPGDVAQYRLLHRVGTPLANQDVAITSAELSGPYAKLIRPSVIATDSAGVLYLEGLATGDHKIEIKGQGIIRTVRVPALGAPMQTPLDLKVE